MACFGRMHKECRRAGACQGRCEFSSNVPGLANATDHNAPLTFQDDLQCLGKRLIKPKSKLLNGARLDVKHAPGEVDRLLR